jgi:hypothetical protein
LKKSGAKNFCPRAGDVETPRAKVKKVFEAPFFKKALLLFAHRR